MIHRYSKKCSVVYCPNSGPSHARPRSSLYGAGLNVLAAPGGESKFRLTASTPTSVPSSLVLCSAV
jgi:hypothetical protein